MSSLTIDGTATSDGSGSTVNLHLTTSQTNDIIYVVVGSNSQTLPLISSITDTAGLTWISRGDADAANLLPASVSIYYAVATSALSGDFITINLNASSNFSALAFGINGTDVTNPSDPFWTANANIQAGFHSGSGTSSATSISTASTNPFVLSILFGTADTTANWSYPSGYTDIIDDTGQTPNAVIYSTYKAYSGVLNNATISWTNSSNVSNQWFIITDVFLAPGGTLDAKGEIGISSPQFTQYIYCNAPNFVSAETVDTGVPLNATLAPIQPKSFVGNDGYYYIVYPKGGNILYASSTTGLSWTIHPLLSPTDLNNGDQFCVWYDFGSGVFVIARVPLSPDGNFYYSVGSVSGGIITLSVIDSPQATINYMSPSGNVYYPNVYTDGTYFWVSLATTPDGTTAYNEVWQAIIGTYSWTNVYNNTVPAAPNQAFSIIIGVTGGTILVEGTSSGSGAHIVFHYSTNYGSSWTYGGQTSGIYELTFGGYTPFRDTIYLINSNGTDIEAISYKLAGSITEVDTGLPITNASNEIGIATDGSRFYIFYGLFNAPNMYYSYSNPCGTVALGSLTWHTPLILSSVDSDIFSAMSSPLAYPSPLGPTILVSWEENNGLNPLRTIVVNPDIYIVNGEIGTSTNAISDINSQAIKGEIGSLQIGQAYSQSGISVSGSSGIHMGAQTVVHNVVSGRISDSISGRPATGFSITGHIGSSIHGIAATGFKATGEIGASTSKSILFPSQTVSGSIGANVLGLTNESFVNVTDSGYLEERVSVTRMPAFSYTGAAQLTSQEQDYIALSYQQMIDMVGQPITFNIQKIIGEDEYQHPIFAYTPITVNAVVTDMQNEQYEYVDQGLLPVHYAMMWTYYAQPQVGDQLVWQDLVWEVRNSFPKVIGKQTIYYRTLLRRILTKGTLLSGGTDPVFGDET